MVPALLISISGSTSLFLLIASQMNSDCAIFILSVIVILALLLLFGGLYSIYVYAYQQKGSYRTNEPKNLESPSSARPLTETLRREKKNLPEIEEEFRSD